MPRLRSHGLKSPLPLVIALALAFPVAGCGAEDVEDKARDTASEAEKKTRDAADKAKDAGREAKDKAETAGEKTKDEAKDKAN